MQQLSLFPSTEEPRDSAAIAYLSSDALLQDGSAVSLEKQKRSDPLLLSIWLRLARTWFPARDDLANYELQWSPRRQKRTLASVSLERNRVFVARELNYPKHHHWLDPLLFHEMCHAYLRSEYHDRRFFEYERRHPGIKPFDIWIDEGGWLSAIRSDRAKRWHTEKARANSA